MEEVKKGRGWHGNSEGHRRAGTIGANVRIANMRRAKENETQEQIDGGNCGSEAPTDTETERS